MFGLRPFRNTDPPALLKVWHSQGSIGGYRQSITLPVFEDFVLAKPYFDRRGLIVAEHDGRVVGFVHAGFGPNEHRTDIAHHVGITCMLQMLPEFVATKLGHQLLAASEAYLAEHQVERLIGGAYPPFIPFYHGLCKSSEIPGVLAGDNYLHSLYRESGYKMVAEFALLDCKLAHLRPVVDRNQRQLSRSFDVRPTLDHSFDNWFDTCAFGPVPRSQFEIIAKSDNRPCGSMLWWDLEAAESRFGVAIAISRVQIVDERRRTGLATFLVRDAMKQLKSSGAQHAQVQVPVSNQPGVDFFRKLGFVEVGRGMSYEKHA